ncbi:MAG: DUF1015 domain-containing protein [Firmicutes bacterium]|nr:DUF1015 domain-containing protein [Bacillota bacterium]
MKIPVKFGEVLLPKSDVDMEKWCVVACDQYTSQPEYWHDLDHYIGDAPSTLRMIFPESFLEDEPQKRIGKIIAHMEEYLDKNIFRAVDNGLILVERTSPTGAVRHGLTMLVDLTAYSFRPEDKALIRATEGTVIERIPPRVEIRKNCPLELPHILVLIDDEDRTVIEPLIGGAHTKLYDTALNKNGGHVRGFHIADHTGVEKALNVLLEKSIEKYGQELLFAVGDGNHSLATAKACYREDIPASRYALVEVENIYDEGIVFEPIHRVVFPNNPKLFVEKLRAIGGTLKGTLFVGENVETFMLPENSIEGVDRVQKLIDLYLKEHGGRVDYIHGEEDLRGICAGEGGIGIVLKAMDKGTLFDYVVKNGVLPRKTFSMGEANEKRYYIECRKIR